jgi:hypothetical protein
MQRAAQLQADAISAGGPQPLAVLGGELGINCGAELAGDLAHSGGGVARVVMSLGWSAMTRPYNARPWLQRQPPQVIRR